jgi:protein-tyrosine phosphatase
MAEVLFVCTGNLCRSPSAAWFLTQRLRQVEADDILVSSAGTVGTTGGPPEYLVEEGIAFGLDLSGHVPRRMEVEDVERSDLVIGMAREHVREAVLLHRDSFEKAYTLREFVRRGRDVGGPSFDEPLAEWLRRVHGGRRHLDLVGDSRSDDIPDPIGGPPEGYRQMLIDVKRLTDELHSIVWG